MSIFYLLAYIRAFLWFLPWHTLCKNGIKSDKKVQINEATHFALKAEIHVFFKNIFQLGRKNFQIVYFRLLSNRTILLHCRFFSHFKPAVDSIVMKDEFKTSTPQRLFTVDTYVILSKNPSVYLYNWK